VDHADMHMRKRGHLLLEQNGTEAGVESTDTLIPQHLAEAANEAVGVGGLRDETDTGSLERALVGLLACVLERHRKGGRAAHGRTRAISAMNSAKPADAR
jgi:hypothetical protein